MLVRAEGAVMEAFLWCVLALGAVNAFGVLLRNGNPRWFLLWRFVHSMLSMVLSVWAAYFISQVYL